MNRRGILQAAGAAAVLNPFAVAEAAAEGDEGRCRSFLRSLPPPDRLGEGPGYAFSFAGDGRGVDDRLPEADAYGRIVLPRTVLTVAFGADDRAPGVATFRARGHEPADWKGNRSVFIARSGTRYRAVVPGAENAVFGAGPSRSHLLDALAALDEGHSDGGEWYHERSSVLRTVVDHLGGGTYLSATLRPDGSSPDVVGAGDRAVVQDGDVRIRGVTVFESVAAAARPAAITAAEEAAPLPGTAARAVRREGRAVLRETTVRGADVELEAADGR